MKLLWNRKGFTLAEMIMASVILCIAVLAISSISVRALGGIRLNRQYNTASELAEKQLVMIDYIGVEKFVEAGRMEGNTEVEEFDYHWKASAKSVGIENLYQVKIVISWTEKKRNYEVAVETRLNGTGSSAKAEKL